MNRRNGMFTDGTERQEKGNGVRVKAFMHQLSGPDERKEYLDMLLLGSKFDMRARAIFFFYGPDLIAYKRKHPTSPKVNEFLRIFSAYLTTQLEDDCPPSWAECGPSFWEELFTTALPHSIRVSVNKKEISHFLVQLKRFVLWLDKRSGCSWYQVVEKYVEEYKHELQVCEDLINELHLAAFPKLHQNGWDPVKDMERISSELKACSATLAGLFEVRETTDLITTIHDLNSSTTYQVVHFPAKKQIPGILIDGVIGKTEEDFYWTWYFTEGVFPNGAKKYIQFADSYQ